MIEFHQQVRFNCSLFKLFNKRWIIDFSEIHRYHTPSQINCHVLICHFITLYQLEQLVQGIHVN